MAKALRAADIRGCIHCFTACGKPCGDAGRATAVSCGVCLNNCRGGCCGLGTCCAGIGNCCAGLCTCLAKSIVAVLVLALIVTVAVLVYAFWGPIVTGFDSIRNSTVEYYDKTVEDPNVVGALNKTEEYYGVARDKITELGSHPEVQRVGNKTAELYDAAKDQVVQVWDNKEEYYEAAKNGVLDTYDKVRQHEAVQSAVNGTMNFFSSLKDKFWG